LVVSLEKGPLRTFLIKSLTYRKGTSWNGIKFYLKNLFYLCIGLFRQQCRRPLQGDIDTGKSCFRHGEVMKPDKCMLFDGKAPMFTW